MIQQIIVYIIVAVAVGYLVKKFFLPKRVKAVAGKESACGKSDCGCH